MPEGKRHRSMLAGVRRALWSDPAKRRMTEQIPIIDERMAQSIIDLAMRVAEVMLSIGASAKEVTLAALRITTAYGLRSVHVNVTFNSVILSDHRNGAGDPITLMQVVRSAAPDHAKLQRLQALVNEIESGMPLDDAIAQFHTVRRTPFMYRTGVTVVVQALLGVAVALMYGAGPFTLLLAFVTVLAIALAQLGLAHLRVPLFFTQAAGGIVLVACAVGAFALSEAGVGPFVDVRPSVLVSSGIVMMLAGLAVVGAAQDAIDGFSLTAGGRILDIAVMTMGLVVGILVGLEAAHQLGFGLQMPEQVLDFGTSFGHLAGAVLISAAVAVLNGAGIRIILVSAVLGAAAWAGWYVLTAITGMPSAGAVFGGALLASFIGSVVADRLSVPSIAVTTAAMIPWVPGTSVFLGLLGFVSADADQAQFMSAFDSLFTAAMTGIALASGATLGIMIGSPLRVRIGGRTVLMRSKARPVSAAGGTAAFEVVRTEPVEAPELDVEHEPPVAETDDPHPITRPYDPKADT
ncbi:threonine/serine ThrE exporter family protein [Microbacterium karelineae]|uniref:threonine/serine ThrE exporter family protein n=1 Tax=Microbacterium karelineae TaxID=2654283 RepID=UPI001E6442ED|nr:threonine/serine exporter family protein [Microbacterium karelineae]